MKRWQIVVPAAFVLLSASTFFLSSCSLVGLLGGSIIDARTPDNILVQSWDIDTLERGDEVRLYLKDGSEVTGAFAGLKQDSLPDYQKRFSAFCEVHPFPPEYPKPGDSLTVDLNFGRGFRPFPMVLLAYDVDTLVLEMTTGTRHRLATRHAPVLEFGQTPVSTSELMRYVQSESVPLLTSIKIQVDPERPPRSIPITDIHRIYVESSSNAARTGFLVGLAIDAIVVAVILITDATEEEKPRPVSGGGNSCPFIYSHNGREYVLDAEVFSGSIVKSLQRTDTVRLSQLEAVDGIARLKITNELPETQYIDQLSLFAADNSAGVEVLPGVDGRIHTLSAPQIPFDAMGYDGSTVTNLVSLADGIPWVSNPAGRDPAEPATTRDGLVLRFHRPARATDAKLVLTLRNTLWLTEIEAHLMRLPGARLHDWYAHMNSSRDASDAFKDLLKREAMLRVDIWNKESWLTSSYIPFVGPYIERSLVLPLDLTEIDEDELQIRIESSPGFWMVDRAQVDFTPDVSVHQTPLTINRAHDRKGSKLRDLLERIDDAYYVLEQGDEAELEIGPLPDQQGKSRAYMLVSTGYYTISIRPEGAPRRDLMVKLAGEPGTFGGYTTGLFNRWLDGERGREAEQLGTQSQ